MATPEATTTIKATAKTAPKVMFLSEMCVLDRNSGAAISMRSWLEVLTREGFECSSVTMSLFDGATEYPFQREIAPRIDPQENIGKRLRFTQDGVEHNIYLTGTSLGKSIKREQLLAFQKIAAEDIRRIKPDVVIGYGSANLNPLRRLAKSLGARAVFYLANGSYTEAKKACFDEVSDILVPSEALRDLYKERLGLDAKVMNSVVKRFIDPETFTPERKTAERKTGFVTLINPDPLKGGALFLQLVKQAQTHVPNVTFLAVESRGNRSIWEKAGVNLNSLTNLWWVPKQKEIGRVFERTSILLMPSIWFEAAGRVVPEAQLCGIPVLGHNIGGIPGQMNGAGFVFDIPDRIKDKPGLIPTPEEVKPWLDKIKTLMEDDKAYLAASKAALKAAQKFSPEARRDALVETFTALCNRDTPPKPRQTSLPR